MLTLCEVAAASTTVAPATIAAVTGTVTALAGVAFMWIKANGHGKRAPTESVDITARAHIGIVETRVDTMHENELNRSKKLDAIADGVAEIRGCVKHLRCLQPGGTCAEESGR